MVGWRERPHGHQAGTIPRFQVERAKKAAERREQTTLERLYELQEKARGERTFIWRLETELGVWRSTSSSTLHIVIDADETTLAIGDEITGSGHFVT